MTLSKYRKEAAATQSVHDRFCNSPFVSTIEN